MVDSTSDAEGVTCVNCGFAGTTGGEEWETADHPSLGTLARCPECGSTDLVQR